MSIEANVFNLQRYSLNDGTGIRTLVFFKGCPLKCLWCANPEGMRREPTLMYFEQNCVGCGRCIEICAQEANTCRNGKVEWHRELCVECMRCVSVCIAEARHQYGRLYTVEELLEEVQKDQIFYNGSQGGVTVSGGEPLLQAEAAAAFLKQCKSEYGLNTAIETSAFAPWAEAKKVFDYVDIFHIDIKHMNTNTHRKLTGVGNEQILSNIKKIAGTYDFSKRSLIIRIPVIPGLNSSDENMRETLDFVKSLGVVKRIDLLPYHTLGVAKYNQMRMGTYALDFLGSGAPEELIRHFEQMVRQEKIEVKIGG